MRNLFLILLTVILQLSSNLIFGSTSINLSADNILDVSFNSGTKEQKTYFLKTILKNIEKFKHANTEEALAYHVNDLTRPSGVIVTKNGNEYLWRIWGKNFDYLELSLSETAHYLKSPISLCPKPKKL